MNESYIPTLPELVLHHLNPTLLEEFFDADYAKGERARKRDHRRRAWSAAVAAVACFVLLITGVATTLGRLDYHLFLAACGAYPGQIVDGDYYCFVPHRGVVRYSPEGGSELLLPTFWVDSDEWQANEHGIYYENGRSLYLRDHESGRQKRLYTADLRDTTHIAFTLTSRDTVVVTCYDKHAMTYYEVVLDGVSGEVLLRTQPQSYTAVKYGESHYTLGSRELTLVQTTPDEEVYLDLREDGVSLLPTGARASKYSATWYGETLWFSLRYDEQDAQDYGKATFLILSPDGKDKIVTLPEQRYSGGDGEYLFYPMVSRGTVGCVAVATGESWELVMGAACDDLHDLVSDGEYLYTTAPWTQSQTVWRIVRDKDGKPLTLQLIDRDITDH